MEKTLTIVINALQGGGAEQVAVTLANHLSKSGYIIEFVVLNLRVSVYQDQINPNIKFTNLSVSHARGSFFAFFKYIKKFNPQTILVFNHELAVILSILRILMIQNFRLVARNINPLSEIRKHERSFWHKYIKDWFII